MLISQRTSILVALAALLVTAVACGGNGDDRATVPPNPTSTPRPTEVPAPTETPLPPATSTPTPPTPTPAPPTPTPTPVTPTAAFLAQLDLAGRLNIGPNTITILDYEPGTWPTSAYGCPLPGTVYLQVEVTGWNVSLRGPDQTYEYHTDEDGQVLVNCTENRDIERRTINIVSLADLRSTTSIEMRRRDSTGAFALKNTVTEPAEIEAIVDTLDVPLLPGPAASCTEVFRLVFITPGGDQTIGTICGGNSRLVRGDQSFWAGQDAEAPSEFGSIIGPYFADEPIPTLPS